MSLFVGNLYVNIRESELREVFGRYGSCKIDLKVSKLLPSGHQKKYAFIDFDDWRGAE